MDRTTAETRMRELVGDTVAALLSPIDLDEALSRAHTVDSAGRLPGQDGYVDTFEPYWAAAEAVTMVAVRQLGQDRVTEVSSEGSTFKMQLGDLWAMASALRARSPLTALLEAASGGLGVIEVGPSGTGYDPTSRGWPSTRMGGIVGNWT